MVRPFSGEHPDLLDLAKALASICGVLPEYSGTGSRAAKLLENLAARDKVLVLLIDGFGKRMSERLPPGGFLLRTPARELVSVFPSATAPALTTLTTACPPSVHGILGWKLFVPELGRRVLPIPFLDPETRQPLEALGIRSESVYPVPSAFRAASSALAFFHPREIAGSEYSRYFSAGRTDIPYDGLDEGLKLAGEWLSNSRGPSLAFVYHYELDLISHRHGPGSSEAAELVRAIDSTLESIRSSLPECGLVVTGDHGQITVARDDRTVLAASDPLMRLLRFAPTGEMRAPIFHVIPGAAEEFRDLFEARFGESWILLDPASASGLGLFGKAPLARGLRGRFGDFLAIPTGPSTLQAETSRPAPGAPVPVVIGAHGGLSADEMLLPLFVA